MKITWPADGRTPACEVEASSHLHLDVWEESIRLFHEGIILTSGVDPMGWSASGSELVLIQDDEDPRNVAVLHCDTDEDAEQLIRLCREYGAGGVH